jgi:type II secretory pathway pseudopilin PulG
MQSAQVPVWVPIVVAIIGILGVIAGQVFSSWRDDRRWSREVHREDARALREIESAQLARDHDLRIRWIDQRLDAYAACLSAYKEWLDILREELARLRTADGEDDLGRRSRACHDAVVLAVDRVHLIGSSEAINACISTYSKFHRYSNRVNIADEPAWMLNEPVVLQSMFEDEIVPAFWALRDSLRRDLGVEPTNIRDE